jgi:hypothetical protein
MFPLFRSIWCFSRLSESHLLKFCAVCVFTGTIASAQAQPWQTLGAWQLSAGWQDYSEPQMQLKGPELGAHWQSLGLAPFTLEADAHLGLQNYSSAQSGRLDSVLNLDTRWRALRTSADQPQWQYGLALHTHANFLRGTTSLGFGGYDRLSTQVWLPVRWRSDDAQPWTVDAGWLLWGEHVSRLSQVNTSYQDITNTQRKGVYLQVSQKVHSGLGALEPYARWTWVDISDKKVMNVAGQKSTVWEPEHTRLQVGVKWHFR